MEVPGVYVVKVTDGKFLQATTLVLASDLDAIVKTSRDQAFVFVQDHFAGTLSPRRMDSRTDGALSEVRLLSASSIEATFLRYTAADPLCCPSRFTAVRYRIERRGQLPVVVPVSARSKPSG